MKREPPSREKWARWLGELRDEVLALFLYRKFWREIVGAAEAAKVPPSYFFTFFTESYLTRQAIAVRRTCKARYGLRSFRNLLVEIRDHPKLTTNRTDAQDVMADIRSLNAGSLGRVCTYVDKQIAHKEDVRPEDVPTIAELHEAVDRLGELLRKYMMLVLDESQMLDTVVAGDFMAPFRMAWLPSLSERPHRGSSSSA